MPVLARRCYPVCLLALVCGLAQPVAAADQTYSLVHKVREGELARVQLVFRVGGDLKLAGTAKTETVPMSVEAKQTYDERVLAVRPNGRAATRATRYYSEATAEIKIDKGGEAPKLPADRRLMSVEMSDDTTSIYSPAAQLTREELDLVNMPANSLLVSELLPEAPVAIGAVWKHDEKLLGRMVGFDAVSLGEVESTLVEVTGDLAKISLGGTVHGAVEGIASEVELRAKYEYDLRQKRVTWFALLIKENRGIGHVGPGLDVTAKLIMTVTPLAESQHLTAKATAALAKEPAPEAMRLALTAPSGTWRLAYDRVWHVTSVEPKLVVLRMVSRGELVAQCNLSPLPPQPAGKKLTLAEYQADIQRSLDKSFGQFVNASQGTDAAGSQVYRVVANGMVSQLPVQWIYYLVTPPNGSPVSLAFTMEGELVERFESADRALVAALRFTTPDDAARQQPTVAR